MKTYGYIISSYGCILAKPDVPADQRHMAVKRCQRAWFVEFAGGIDRCRALMTFKE